MVLPSLSEAKTALASWCRRNPQVVATVKAGSEKTLSVAAILNLIKKTEAGMDFLEQKMAEVRERLKADDRDAMLHYIMATYAFETEHYQLAEKHVDLVRILLNGKLAFYSWLINVVCLF